MNSKDNSLDHKLVKDSIFESFSQDLFSEVSKLVEQYGVEELRKKTSGAIIPKIEVIFIEERFI